MKCRWQVAEPATSRQQQRKEAELSGQLEMEQLKGYLRKKQGQ